MKTVNVTTPIKLTSSQLNHLKANLKLQDDDVVNQIIDPSVIAGILVDVDGVAVDLTVKHQLNQIARG